MKKFFVLILGFMLMFSLTACSGDDSGSAGSDNSGSEQTVSLQEETEHENDTKEYDTEKTAEKEDSKNYSKTESDITFTELTAVDTEECSIKITGVDPDDEYGCSVKILCENKSADRTYTFSVESAAVNGVQCGAYFATDIAAGKKANDKVELESDELEKYGITEYTDIQLDFRICDDDTWDDILKQTVHIYPYGENKAVKFSREAQPDDNVIVDNDYVTAIVTGYEKDEWGYHANMFLINKTDKNVVFYAEDVSVNDFMVEPYFSTFVSAGNSAFGTMEWYGSDLEENDITDVEKIEFKLLVYNDSDWSDDDLVNEAITLTP